MDKILILKAHYKIEEEGADRWHINLMMRLCLDFFPGFSIKGKEKRGRKAVWDVKAQLKLVLDVTNHKLAYGGTDAEACAAILKAEGKERATRNNINSLRNRLSDARGSGWRMFEKMLQDQNTTEEQKAALMQIAQVVLDKD